jgi:hypothetical protein
MCRHAGPFDLDDLGGVDLGRHGGNRASWPERRWPSGQPPFIGAATAGRYDLLVRPAAGHRSPPTTCSSGLRDTYDLLVRPAAGHRSPPTTCSSGLRDTYDAPVPADAAEESTLFVR